MPGKGASLVPLTEMHSLGARTLGEHGVDTGMILVNSICLIGRLWDQCFELLLLDPDELYKKDTRMQKADDMWEKCRRNMKRGKSLAL